MMSKVKLATCAVELVGWKTIHVEVHHVYLEGLLEAWFAYVVTLHVSIPDEKPTTMSFFAETDIGNCDRPRI